MGSSNWQPKWWSADKQSGWERVKEAMRRDWEQTKNDVSSSGRDLDQDVNDTVKQAAGSDVIPGRNQPNKPGGTPEKKSTPSWDDAALPLSYGYGARQQYGAQHTAWDDTLEGKLKQEWDEGKEKTGHAWNDVKHNVRRGYEHNGR
jgi:hypothetical protein